MGGISSKAAGTLQNKEKTFQGQRFDDELGINWIQFKWRNHDPQIGRFIEVDPLSEKYVYNSTYAFSENRVINGIELEGLEFVPFGYSYNGSAADRITKNNQENSQTQLEKDQDASMKLDVIPFVGQFKMVYEIFTGKDLITGEKLSNTQRGLMALPFWGTIMKDTRSFWKIASITERGLAIEKYLGGNLPKNFPVIDKLLNGTATSIKSIDLTAKSYKQGNGLFNTLTGYINKLDNFSIGRQGDYVVKEGVDFTRKTLEIAIEPGKATLSKWEQIGNAMKYAKGKGIDFKLQFVN
jgi:RHS repeat-associated protein